jgi:hypothetical protein
VQLDPSYLTTITDRDEVERRLDFTNCPDDFRDDWRRLLSKMQDEDELWNFGPTSKTHHELSVGVDRHSQSNWNEIVGLVARRH